MCTQKKNIPLLRKVIMHFVFLVFSKDYTLNAKYFPDNSLKIYFP